MNLVVLASKDGLVAVAKPPGVLVIPGRTPEDQRCARDMLATQLGQRVWVCHRIDRDTSGVVLFATDEKAHRAASMAFEQGLAKKKYLALVEGVVSAPLDIDLPLAEGRKGGQMRLRSANDAEAQDEEMGRSAVAGGSGAALLRWGTNARCLRW